MTNQNFECAYADLIRDLLKEGSLRETRNHPTYSTFGKTLVIDTLQEGLFPLLNGRKIFYKGVLGEFAAFLVGANHVDVFKDFGCNYWGQWADEEGSLKIDYGRAWRDFEGKDQLASVIKTLKENPQDRRMLISGWRPHKVASLSLPCCHLLYQWYVNSDNELEMMWYQRSVDVMVGLPSDIVLAAIWNVLLAKETGYDPGKIHMFLGDTHIYKSHLDSGNVDKYLSLARSNTSPIYTIEKESCLNGFLPEHLTIHNYNPHPPIKFEVYA